MSNGTNNLNHEVDLYLEDGCGRCTYYKTPECKVHRWTTELTLLRKIVIDCGLTEDYKWSQPCYTFKGKNVIMVTAFKDHAVLSFFKGVLLKDSHKLLVSPGVSSQANRQFRFTKASQIIEQEAIIRSYIFEALEIEKAGLKVEFKRDPETMPEELLDKFEEFPDFKTAFEALTPGRRRGYILHFGQPKQSVTRTSRIEKCMPKIFEGKGFLDR